MTHSNTDKLALAIAQGAGLGRLPVAPGSWASLATLLLGWGIHSLGGLLGMVVITILLFFLGLWAVHRTAWHEKPRKIVIGDIVGQLVALLPSSVLIEIDGALILQLFGIDGTPEVLELWPVWAASFILFRIGAILKWCRVRAKHYPSPSSIMFDGLIVGGSTACLIALFMYWFLALIIVICCALILMALRMNPNQ